MVVFFLIPPGTLYALLNVMKAAIFPDDRQENGAVFFLFYRSNAVNI